MVGPNIPLATNATVPIGTGNLWGIREGTGYPVPTAHMPYMAAGPGLFLDPSQTISRGVSITGVASGTGGNVIVSGWDVYWQPMTQTIAIGAGVNTVSSTKAFKAIKSVIPQFTDAHTYSCGTTDTFGMHFRSDKWEYTNIFWNGGFASSSAGWTAAVKTNPATATTGDVRGTVAVGTIISPYGAASNGTLSSLAMTGRRLAIFQSMPLYNMTQGTPSNPAPMYGVTQV